MIWDCPTIVRPKDVPTARGGHCSYGSIARGHWDDDCYAGGSAEQVCAWDGNVADDSCGGSGLEVG